jgi:hypothetical protein
MQVQLVMADNDATPSNPLVAPVQQEELEEAPFALNVFQRPREEELPRRVVRTRVDCSVWERRLSGFFTIVIYPLSQLFSCNSPGPTQVEMLILKLDFNST